MKRKILLVEDDELIRKLVQRALREDYEVMVATNGQEGYEKYRNTPDLSLVLSDIDMPELNGFGLTKLIRQTDSHTPIILMSGNNPDEYSPKAKQAGANQYFEKPFDLKVLKETIKKYVGEEE